eukprot:15115718-Ditylum_brightwellii.AAC.1
MALLIEEVLLTGNKENIYPLHNGSKTKDGSAQRSSFQKGAVSDQSSSWVLKQDLEFLDREGKDMDVADMEL